MERAAVEEGPAPGSGPAARFRPALRTSLCLALATLPAFLVGGGLATAAWLALVAPAVGFGAGARFGFSRDAALALALAAALGGLALAAAGPRDAAGLGAIAWTGGALASLAVFGLGLGARCARWGTGGACALFLAATAASLAPPLAHRAGLGPAVTSAALDLSPWTFAAESLGVDWMRHPAVYDPAGTEWYSDTRRAYPSPARDGGLDASLGAAGPKALAAPLLLVVGCALGLSTRRSSDRRRGPGGPTPATRTP